MSNYDPYEASYINYIFSFDESIHFKPNLTDMFRKLNQYNAEIEYNINQQWPQLPLNSQPQLALNYQSQLPIQHHLPTQHQLHTQHSSYTQSELDLIQQPETKGSESDNKAAYYVYLLQSLSNPKKTYIGYTIDPVRRLRQHNGEISGGAERTKYARPWKMICYVTGFPNSKTALQFEWLNNHAKKMGLKQRNGVRGRIKTICDALQRPRFASTSPPTVSMKLYIVWLTRDNYTLPKKIKHCEEVHLTR